MNNLSKTLFSLAAILTAILPATAYDFTDGTLNYSIIDNEARTCRVDGWCNNLPPLSNRYTLVIPESVQFGDIEYSVTEIGPKAFYQRFGYLETKVSLPGSISRIGRKAFAKCHGLISINFPESMVEIADSAFYDCVYNCFLDEAYIPDINWWIRPEKETIRMPDGIKRIGNGAFHTMYNIDIANFPKQLEEIGDYAFYKRPPVDLILPDKLTSIGKKAFFYNESFTYHECGDLKIPDNVTYIGPSAFSGLIFGNLALSSGLTTVGDSAFYNTDMSSIVIPEGVEHIGNSAFNGCRLPEEVSLPSSLVTIGEHAFYRCGGLSRVSLSASSLTSIGDYAFGSCNLLEISFPPSLVSIGDYAFSGAHFTQLPLPESLSEIGVGTFQYCRQLQKVVLPANLTELPQLVFAYCNRLTSIVTASSQGGTDGEIVIPGSIRIIGPNAFCGCNKFRSVRLPSSVESMKSNPFAKCENLESVEVDKDSRFYKVEDGVLMTKTGDSLIFFPISRGGVYHIPHSVTTIAANAFSSNKRIEKIIMDDNVSLIGAFAFAGCESLTDVVFSKSLVEIGTSAFNGTAVRDIVWPATMKILGLGSFNDIPDIRTIRIYGEYELVDGPLRVNPNSLEAIYYLSPKPQWDNMNIYEDESTGEVIFEGNIEWGIYPGTTNNTPLYVLSQTYDEIKNGTGYPWSKFNNIQVYDPTDDPYFNNSSVQEITDAGSPESRQEIYNLNGVRIDGPREALPAGIYIVRNGSSASKIVVR